VERTVWAIRPGPRDLVGRGGRTGPRRQRQPGTRGAWGRLHRCSIGRTTPIDPPRFALRAGDRRTARHRTSPSRTGHPRSEGPKVPNRRRRPGWCSRSTVSAPTGPGLGRRAPSSH